MPETQAFSAPRSVWTPPSGTLGELVAAAYARATAQSAEETAWRGRAEAAPPGPSFRAALNLATVAVIAEVKRKSPSRGAINVAMNAVSRAREYATAGAAAISVLTEPDRFGGTARDLAEIAAGVQLPVLRKDFIVSSVQLYEARALGASAALLIVRALPPSALLELHDIGTTIGLDLLVEVRDESELSAALDVGARVIGVNNRNLETLVIEPATVGRIVPLIPRGVIAVAESGMTSRSDVERAANAGADAVLIGSAVSAAVDAVSAVSPLTQINVERNARPR